MLSGRERQRATVFISPSTVKEVTCLDVEAYRDHGLSRVYSPSVCSVPETLNNISI